MYEVSVYNKWYIIKNENDNVVTKESIKEAVDFYYPILDFIFVETKDENDKTIGFDYWVMYGGK